MYAMIPAAAANKSTLAFDGARPKPLGRRGSMRPGSAAVAARGLEGGAADRARSAEHPAPSPSQCRRLARFNAVASVDVHCHCLPGLDDGPASLAEALNLCAALVADGITHVVATAHQLGRYASVNNPQRIRAAVRALAGAGIPLSVLPGGDVRLDERLPALLADDAVMTVADHGRHVLLEQPWDVWLPPGRLVEALAARGVQPVLTHPERHPRAQRDPVLVRVWVEAGALVQVTAGSVCGAAEPAAEHSAWQLLRAGLVHVIASDAHDAHRRPPRMSEAIDRIAAVMFHAAARSLCIEIPDRLVRGEQIVATGAT